MTLFGSAVMEPAVWEITHGAELLSLWIIIFRYSMKKRKGEKKNGGRKGEGGRGPGGRNKSVKSIIIILPMRVCGLMTQTSKRGASKYRRATGEKRSVKRVIARQGMRAAALLAHGRSASIFESKTSEARAFFFAEKRALVLPSSEQVQPTHGARAVLVRPDVREHGVEHLGEQDLAEGLGVHRRRAGRVCRV